MISILALPFLACVLLVLIHVYFGAYVLRRGIIFIDLALAQWAALGYLVGNWLGIHGQGLLFLISFGFTVLASALLATIKRKYTQTAHLEAVIGVLYILGTTLAIALISSTGMEGHHLQEMLSGHLLFVHLHEIGFSAILYAVIACIMVYSHSRFIQSQSTGADFLFYALFGLVVTSSVHMVGVLLVFSFLVLPLLTVLLHIKSFSKQIYGGWAIGALGSAIGLGLSMVWDIPPTYCVILGLAGLWVTSILWSMCYTRSW